MRNKELSVLAAKKVYNVDMDIYAVYKGTELETVFIQKADVKLSLTAKEWVEIQKTMQGKKYKVSVGDINKNYIPELTILKNKNKYIS